MALITSPVYDITVSMVDRDRNLGSVTLHCPTSVLIGAVQAGIAEFIIPALEGISNAKVKSWSISTSAVDSAAADEADEASDVERKGVFSFRAANGASYVMSVPSIMNEKVIDTTNKIDLSDEDVAAFVTAITNADILDLIKPTTYLGSDITGIEKAEKHHRGSRRG